MAVFSARRGGLTFAEHPLDVIPRLSPTHRLGLTLVGAVVLALGAASSATSCSGNQREGFGGGGGGVAVNHGKELFAGLDQDLYAVCGSCHDAGGIADAPFLAGPDHYRSITSWPGIIVKDPTQSKLETIPVSGPQHPYKKLDSVDLNDTLYAKVKVWLDEEAKALAVADQAEAGKAIDPFAPILGFDAVYLDALGAEFTGMALTFNADQLDDHTLKLSDIEVHPTAKLGVHMVHPLFTVIAPGADPDPDPVDSFSNVDNTFEAGKAGLLGPGTLLLTNWRADGKLTIGFEKIEIINPVMMGDGGVVAGACKDVGSFTTNAAPLLMANCVGCHGGANAMAVGAVDMTALSSDPAATCAQVRNRVNPPDPPSSQLFITTDPGGNAAHPFKFGGDVNNFNGFKGQVSTWISAEQ